MGFLHRFQQGRLGLGAGPVDLIGEHDVGEHRAGSEDELPLGWPLPNRQASASRIAAVLPRRNRSTSASTASWGVTEARDDLLDLLPVGQPCSRYPRYDRPSSAGMENPSIVVGRVSPSTPVRGC
jgi:hypothetical protein